MEVGMDHHLICDWDAGALSGATARCLGKV